MKSRSLLYAIIFLVVTISSCRPSRYITEQHIKNDIERHEVGQQSNIKTYNIFRGNTYTSGRYLELTGYKLKGNKGLVVGADRSYVTRRISNSNGGSVETVTLIDFIHLDLEECKSIISNYGRLIQKLKSEKPRMNEEIYHDYTVSKDCFISFRKTGASNGSENINIWIKGEKYSVPTTQFINRLKKFIEY